MWKKVLNWIIGIVFIATVVFAIVQSARVYFIERELEKSRTEVEQYMEQFRLARERNEQYERYYNEAKSYNNELGECLSRQSSTLSELRIQLTEVYRIEKEMANLLDSIGEYSGMLGDNNDCSDNRISE